jgi:hypothetical protein
VKSAPRGLVARIAAAYPDFRASMARELAAGRDEPHLLAYVMGGCTALFLTALPRILVTPPPQVVAEGSDGMFAFFLTNLVTFLFFVPLFLYGVAALTRMAARAFGGVGGWRETRLATFWAMLVAAPVLLAASLLSLGLALSGMATAATVVAYGANGVSAWIWAAFIAEAHGFRRTIPVFAALVALAAAVVGLLLVLLPGAGGAT